MPGGNIRFVNIMLMYTGTSRYLERTCFIIGNAHEY